MNWTYNSGQLYELYPQDLCGSGIVGDADVYIISINLLHSLIRYLMATKIALQEWSLNM
jgi:hypothetical protein